MDRKTLEYMEARAKKAREIVTRIDSLKNNKEKMVGVYQVRFIPEHTSEIVISDTYYGKRLLTKLSIGIEKEIESEIKTLEQELAEL